MIQAASSYPGELVGTLVANARLVAGARDAEIIVSLLAGPDQAATEQTLNSFLNCCLDVPRVGRFLMLDTGLSAADRAKLQQRYGFLEFADCDPGDGPAAQLAALRAGIGGRFWLHLGQGWQFFASENLITRLTAVLDAEPQVLQVGINFADAVEPTGACPAEEVVRRTPGGGRYVLADGVASGPAMFDTGRLDQVGGIDGADPDPLAALGRRAAAAGMGTASLDEVLCQRQNARLPRLILAGHSHLNAIAGPHICTGPAEVRAAPGRDGTFIMVGPWPRDMIYWDALADLAVGADVGIIWGGNEHNTCYFFEVETSFDFLSAHVRKMNPSAQIKSKAAIRHRLQQHSPNDLDLVLKPLVAGGVNRIALIGTPPPKADNEALRALLQTEQFFVDRASQLGQSLETIPITDPYVRLKLWYLLQDMLAEEARTRGLMFIPVPKEVQDADGFLKREFWAADVTHANDAYGNVMYETVLQAFK